MEKDLITPRQALIRLAKKNRNAWGTVYADMKNGNYAYAVEDPTPEELRGWEPITILDDTYPNNLRQHGTRPPFVLFAKGDMANLVPGALMIISPKRYTFEGKIGAFLQLIVQARIPAVILWHNPDRNAANNGFALDALRAYQGSGVPFAVILPDDTEDIDAIADGIAASGGLALTEHYPGTPRRLGDPCSRIGASLSKAALVLAGDKGSRAGVDAAFALNAGLDVGAIPWLPLTPMGELCNSLIREGAACVTCVEDVKELLGE